MSKKIRRHFVTKRIYTLLFAYSLRPWLAGALFDLCMTIRRVYLIVFIHMLLLPLVWLRFDRLPFGIDRETTNKKKTAQYTLNLKGALIGILCIFFLHGNTSEIFMTFRMPVASANREPGWGLASELLRLGGGYHVSWHSITHSYSNPSW